MAEIIGRIPERKRLDELYNSTEAEFIALYGRRRVGKTYLITELFREKGLYFDFRRFHDRIRVVASGNLRNGRRTN